MGGYSGAYESQNVSSVVKYSVTASEIFTESIMLIVKYFIYLYRVLPKGPLDATSFCSY